MNSWILILHKFQHDAPYAFYAINFFFSLHLTIGIQYLNAHHSEISPETLNLFVLNNIWWKSLLSASTITMTTHWCFPELQVCKWTILLLRGYTIDFPVFWKVFGIFSAYKIISPINKLFSFLILIT